MKITIATGPIFPVPAVLGGAVQRLWEGLAREFAKCGHEVTIFAREFPGQAKEEIVDGIRYLRRGGYEQSTSIKRDLVQCLIYALKTARNVPPGDVVVTNDFWMPAVLPWLNPTAGKVVPCLQRFPKKQCGLYGKCAALVAVSQAVANAVKAQSPSVAEKIVVVSNAIDDAFLRDTKRPRDQKTKSSNDETMNGEEQWEGRKVGRCEGGKAEKQDTEAKRAVRILYVGRIHPEKGLGLLAEALKRMRQTAYGVRHEAEGERQTSLRDGLQSNRLIKDQGTTGQPSPRDGLQCNQLIQNYGTKGQTDEATAWECVLVGPVRESEGGGGDAFAEELKRELEGLPVRFEAPVYDPAVLAKIYDQADVFVYPSAAVTGEAMPLAPLEAMARGLVPVVSDLKVFCEYLECDVNGVVFDHRGHEKEANLAIALRELVADAKKRERMAAAARKTAEKFSTAVIADKYLQLFAKVISGR